MSHARITKREYRQLLDAAGRDGTFPSIKVDNGGCFYRLDSTAGCKQRCAVGILIPDDKYDPKMECSLWTLERRFPFIAEYFPEGMSIGEMSSIQRAHDGNPCGDVWNHEVFMNNVDAILKLEKEPIV